MNILKKIFNYQKKSYPDLSYHLKMYLPIVLNPVSDASIGFLLVSIPSRFADINSDNNRKLSIISGVLFFAGSLIHETYRHIKHELYSSKDEPYNPLIIRKIAHKQRFYKHHADFEARKVYTNVLRYLFFRDSMKNLSSALETIVVLDLIAQLIINRSCIDFADSYKHTGFIAIFPTSIILLISERAISIFLLQRPTLSNRKIRNILCIIQSSISNTMNSLGTCGMTGIVAVNIIHTWRVPLFKKGFHFDIHSHINPNTYDAFHIIFPIVIGGFALSSIIFKTLPFCISSLRINDTYEKCNDIHDGLRKGAKTASIFYVVIEILYFIVNSSASNSSSCSPDAHSHDNKIPNIYWWLFFILPAAFFFLLGFFSGYIYEDDHLKDLDADFENQLPNLGNTNGLSCNNEDQHEPATVHEFSPLLQRGYNNDVLPGREESQHTKEEVTYTQYTNV